MKNLSIIACLLFPLSMALLADDASFGKKDPGLLNLKGSIYFLSEETDQMPADIERQKPQGVIYTE
ncbi:MAG: hypothetical protein PHX05_04950, partial [Acidobacteriota bacterium]|nr:hypothetical protein [Acidobacteriota bacterium]